jgi:hypothetical protein
MTVRNPRHSIFAGNVAIQSTALSLCVFGSLTVISGLSCLLGTFYDDEIFSIRWATLPFTNVFHFIAYINSNDIHPPVSYLLDKFVFNGLGNWKAVQFVNGVVNAAAIAWFHRQAIEKVASSERILLTFALATAATSEMWGTGLRWNAYFNPAFLILYTFALSSRPSITTRAAILAFGSAFLFHTSYLAIVAAPVLWGTFFVTSFHDLQIARVKVILIISAAVLVCLPQLFVLATVHLPSYIDTDSFSLSVPYSIAQSFSTLILGNAVFPIDYIPGLFLLALSIAAVTSIRTVLREKYSALLLGSCSDFLRMG